MLRLNDVSAGYEKPKPIIKNISLEIKAGEIFIFVGPNGSGKSTLLKTALGLLLPQSGSITLDQKNLHTLSLQERASKISLLESQISIAAPLTVDELLDLSSATSSNSLIKHDVIKALDIKKFLNRSILELSSGEKRRVLLAHALATPSEIIMLDEPFAHLDWRHQIQFVETLVHWQKNFRTTFVLAVHELNLAVQLAHRMAVLDKGNLIACDTPENIFTNPSVGEVFAFQAMIDENPIDGSRRLTLAKR